MDFDKSNCKSRLQTISINEKINCWQILSRRAAPYVNNGVPGPAAGSDKLSSSSPISTHSGAGEKGNPPPKYCRNKQTRKTIIKSNIVGSVTESGRNSNGIVAA